jgi:hypothetical protein
VERTRRGAWAAAALVTSGLALGGVAHAEKAQAPATTTAPAAPKPPAAAKPGAAPPKPATLPAVDPAALAALNGMGVYLRKLKSFHIEARTTDEIVLDDGQKIQREGRATLLAKPPDRLRVHVSNDRRDRTYIFDGKTFTLLAERVNMYATVPAPKTITLLADSLEEKFGMELPLADLFRWGAPGSKPPKITAAVDAGPSVVDGTTCEQYLFRQEDVDWQLWIQKGDFPLPLKLAITTTSDESRPQFTAAYTWNLAPSFNDAAFVFEPPPGSHRVTLAETPSDDWETADE